MNDERFVPGQTCRVTVAVSVLARGNSEDEVCANAIKYLQTGKLGCNSVACVRDYCVDTTCLQSLSIIEPDGGVSWLSPPITSLDMTSGVWVDGYEAIRPLIDGEHHLLVCKIDFENEGIEVVRPDGNREWIRGSLSLLVDILKCRPLVAASSV